MITWFKKYSSILRASIITALEYKANSIVGLFAILSGLLIEYLIWSMIYSSENSAYTIDGWTFNRLIAYIFLAMIIGQLKSSWVTAHEMIMQIRQGFMNQYLIKPLSFFSYHLMNFIGANILYYIPYTILIIITPIIFKDLIFINLIQIPFFIFAVIMSIYLSYSIYFFMVCFAFWFGEVRALLAAYNISMFVLAGQIIPLDFFPEYYINIINYTPIPYLIKFPVDIAMALEVNLNQWINFMFIGILWCIIMRLLSGLVYSIGIRRYEAYGS
jgi:ABC-2 type transport system permease protein